MRLNNLFSKYKESFHTHILNIIYTMPRRLNNLISEICTRENIEISIKQVLRGSERKKRKTGQWILNHQEEVIAYTMDVIVNGSFRLGEYIQTTITEGPKERVIQIIPLMQRVVVNAIMRVIEDHLVKRMINTTASSIIGRGCVYLKKIIERDIRKDPEGTKYFYKIDITKYYDHIPHEGMKKCTRHYIKDKTILPILDNFIEMLPKGLSIGLRSSQVFGNLYLSWILDHKMKTKYHCKYYYRYCDDIVILAGNKKELWKYHDIIKKELLGTNLSIKPSYTVRPVSNGIDYLGYVIYSDKYSRVRKRIKKNALKKMNTLISYRRRREILNAIKGYCKYSQGRHLFNKLINLHKYENSTRVF
jgi:RNA-directed DNA polymerase